MKILPTQKLLASVTSIFQEFCTKSKTTSSCEAQLNLDNKYDRLSSCEEMTIA